MAICKTCGSDFYSFRKGVAGSMARIPKERITEVTGNITQCFNYSCADYNKLQNWCTKCSNWYLAEQPDRGDEGVQCPYCRDEVKRIKAIEVMSENK